MQGGQLMSGRNPFLELLQEPGRRAVVLDGGLATELERQGNDLSQGNLWSARLLADDPKSIQRVHESYYQAGADVATTCSYQASFNGFHKAGISCAEAEELLRRSVRIADAARSACSGRKLVAFSCGTYGAALADGSEYNGSFAEKVTVEQLMDFHMQRLQAVEHEQGIDAIAFETVPCAKEVQAIAQLARTRSLPAPVWVSVSCRDDSHTSNGQDFAAACLPLLLEVPSIVAFGFNCTPPRYIDTLLQKSKAVLQQAGVQKLLLAYPNSGEGYLSAEGGWDGRADLTAKEFGMAAGGWADAGASLIGGCCRTTPAHITSIAHHVTGR